MSDIINENIEKKMITPEGLKKYEDELNYLKVEARAKVAEKIKEAREQGDLSENAEYDAAKDEQRDIETRITELENIIKNVEVVDKSDLKKGVIEIGSKVLLFDKNYKEEIEYNIVCATEADSLNGKISNESPLGQCLIGKKKGDLIEFKVGNNKIKYDVIKVN